MHVDFSVKLLLLRCLVSNELAQLIQRQRRTQLQHLRDLAALERKAQDDGPADLLLIIKGTILHTEADVKWLDLCLLFNQLTMLENVILTAQLAGKRNGVARRQGNY